MYNLGQEKTRINEPNYSHKKILGEVFAFAESLKRQEMKLISP